MLKVPALLKNPLNLSVFLLSRFFSTKRASKQRAKKAQKKLNNPLSLLSNEVKKPTISGGKGALAWTRSPLNKQLNS